MNKRSIEAEEAWLAAGAAVLARQARDLIQFPSGPAVAVAHGKQPDSFDKFWAKRGKKAGFESRLAKYLASTERFAELPELEALLVDLAVANDLASALRQFCKEDYRLIMQSEANASVLALLGASGDRQLRSLLAKMYLQIDDFLEEVLLKVLSVRGLEVSPPLTVRQLAVILNQLCDGLTIRARFDPGTATAALYADAVTALVLGATRPAGTGGHLGERVAQELRR